MTILRFCFFAHPHPQYNRYIVPKNFKKHSIEHGNVVSSGGPTAPGAFYLQESQEVSIFAKAD